MPLVLKKKKSAGSTGDYPKKRTAKRTAAFKLHRKLNEMLNLDEDNPFDFEGSKEQNAGKVMMRPVIDRLGKICGLGE